MKVLFAPMKRPPRPLPREALVKNLRRLIDEQKLSEQALATRSGVAQKTVNKILNGISSPTLDTIDRLAGAFGLKAWNLILPNLPDDLIGDRIVERTVKFVLLSCPEGRKAIEKKAEEEATKIIRRSA